MKSKLESSRNVQSKNPLNMINIKAIPHNDCCAAEVLNKPCLPECVSERLAGVLTSSVTVKDCSADLLRVSIDTTS